MLRALITLTFISGCYGGANLDLVTGQPGDVPSDVPPQVPATPPAPSMPGGDGTLPCELAAMLQARCQTCHSSPPQGAPMALISHAHLVAPAVSDPGRSVAQVALERMKSTVRPMPPAGATAMDIATLEAWVNAGQPKGTCGAANPTGPVTPPGPQPTTCTSGDSWTNGNDGSPLMHPGVACISCHTTQSDAPRLTVGGTVYPSLHETNDCYGDRDVTIEVTDATGRVLNLVSNNYGNFLSTTTLTMPIRARVLFQGRVREMVGAQPTGDCNSCHTEQGANGAPGRILKP